MPPFRLAAILFVLGFPASFSASAAPPPPWNDYQIIIWQSQPPAAYATLKRMGVTAGSVEMIRATGLFSRDEAAGLASAGFGFYLENIATDFYSPYHRFYEGKQVNWRYLELKKRYLSNPSDRSVFLRDPSLSDPAWIARIGHRIADNVAALGGREPLYYSLADEPGIADLAVNWDFDFSPVSLEEMRKWLEGEYGSLDALNREWDARFSRWDDVMPETTDEAIRGPRDNLAAWVDFKTWMDVAFARAIAAGSAAVHAADPHALSAVEGGQIAGGGGWDYARLAGTVDVVELYDRGDNLELVRSFAPNTILLTTSFNAGKTEEHRVWRELLRGTRGLIIWDDNHEFVADDGSLGPRGRAAAPYLAEIRSGLGALLGASERQLAPIAILYSQPSLHVQWLLDRRPDDGAWVKRSSSSEYEDNAIRSATSANLRWLEHQGLQPVFLSAATLSPATLDRRVRVLILPEMIALSPAAASEIHHFSEAGGAVLAEGEPGTFDEHGRRLAKPLLADLFPRAPAQLPSPDDLASRLAKEGISPAFPVLHTDGKAAADVESYVFRNGGATILALLRDLPAAGAAPSDEQVSVALPHPSYAYDLRTHEALGRLDHLKLSLTPFSPTMIALAEQPLAAPTAHVRFDESGSPVVAFTAATADDVMHIEVADAAGHPISMLKQNLLMVKGAAELTLPMAGAEQPQPWTVTARDVLSGGTVTISVQSSGQQRQ